MLLGSGTSPPTILSSGWPKNLGSSLGKTTMLYVKYMIKIKVIIRVSSKNVVVKFPLTFFALFAKDSRLDS